MSTRNPTIGGSGNPQLTAMRMIDPTAVIARVKLAIKTHNGLLTDAALELGVSKRTLSRWIKAHDLDAFVQDARGAR